MALVLDLAGGVFIAIGIVLIGIGGIGLLRLPDAYNRLNAVAKAAGLGLVSVLFGAVLLMPSWATAATLGVAIVLQLLTAPVGAYAIAAGAYRSDTPLAPVTRYDEYADRMEPGRPVGRNGPPGRDESARWDEAAGHDDPGADQGDRGGA